MNIVAISGRITKDPELRKTQAHKSVLSFSIAVNKPNDKQSADFINCVAWEKTAEVICNYCHKGDEVVIAGHISTSTYDERSTGRKRTDTFVVVDRFEFGRQKQKKEDDKFSEFNTGTQVDITNEELPF